MAAMAHGWKPSDPKLARIPVSVAKDFNAADQAKHARLKAAMMKKGMK